jgi:integration host factor subunit beta
MTKKELIGRVRERFKEYSARDVVFACNNLFHMICDALIRGERIEIRGFGVFSVRTRQSRIVRNPRDGSSVRKPEQKKICFKTALAIKKGLSDYEDV